MLVPLHHYKLAVHVASDRLVVKVGHVMKSIWGSFTLLYKKTLLRLSLVEECRNTCARVLTALQAPHLSQSKLRYKGHTLSETASMVAASSYRTRKLVVSNARCSLWTSMMLLARVVMSASAFEKSTALPRDTDTAKNLLHAAGTAPGIRTYNLHLP